MRRISLALALVGAVAATGCGGGAKKSSDAGAAPGVAEGTFKVTIQNGQGQAPNPTTGKVPLKIDGGFVTSSPPGINCGIDATGAELTDCSFEFPVVTVGGAPTVVTLTATANAPKLFFGFAGDCSGQTCTLSGKVERYVVATFGTAADVTGHANWSAPADHVPAYLGQTLPCTQCHGANLQGQGIAVSCASCHSWPYTGVTGDNNYPAPTLGKHFQASGHNSGTCARCHTGDGFRDFIGVDGSSSVTTVQYGSTATAATTITTACSATVTTNCINSGMKCDMCHNAATVLGGGALNQHKFPSGNLLTMDGKTAICSQCHDGGRPGYEVSQLGIAIKAVADDVQLPTADNKTVRAHYVPAASTLFGSEAANWYQVPGNIYTARNTHGGKASCTDCHNAHTGALPADGTELKAKCGACHFDELSGAPVATFMQLEESRQFGFEGDIDGDAVVESVKAEIDGLAAKTYAAIRAYAKDVAGADICAYDNRYYLDNGAGGGTAANGVCETGERTSVCSAGSQYTTSATCTAAGGTMSVVEYNKYTPRLLRAAYNYLIWQNDVGAWAHNPRYAIEVLYDTTAQMNLGLTTAGKTPVANGNRAFNGHFGALEDPSPYAAMIYHGGANAVTGELLPTMGFTSGACYQCHGGVKGLAEYLKAPTAPAWPAATTPATSTPYVAYQVNAIQCATCHVDGANMKGIRSDIAAVNFPPQKNPTATPSPAVVTVASTNLPKSFALCGSCHSGRENGQSITNKGGTDGTFAIGFVNPHYLGAAGMMMGDDAKMMYQYAGNTYTKKPAFWAAGTNGNAPGPHGSPHGAECTGCHQPKASKHEFGVNFAYCNGCHTGQYALTAIEEEYAEATGELLTAIRAYVTANLAAIQTAVGGNFVAGGTTPMTNVCYNANANPYFFVETAAGCSSTSFGKFDPKLLKGAFNYQWTQKEPGAWAHNEFYVLQVVYDSIVDLGGTPTFTVGGAYTPAAEKRPVPPPAP